MGKFQRILNWSVFLIAGIAIFGLLVTLFFAWDFGRFQHNQALKISPIGGIPSITIFRLVSPKLGGPITRMDRFKQSVNSWASSALLLSSGELEVTVVGDQSSPFRLPYYVRRSVLSYAQSSGNADQWLKAVGRMPKLTNISLRGGAVEVGNDSMRFIIENGRHLESLYIDDAKTVDVNFPAMAEAMPNLEVLTLFRTTLSDAEISSIGKLKQLREIRISGMGVNFGQAIVNLPHLESLSIYGISGSPKVLIGSGRHEQLTSLQLSGVNLTDQDIEALGEFAPNLKKLSLLKVDLNLEGAKVFKTLTALEDVTLVGKIDPKGLDLFNSLGYDFGAGLTIREDPVE